MTKENVVYVKYNKALEYNKATVSIPWMIGMILSVVMMNVDQIDLMRKVLEGNSFLELNFNILTYGLLGFSYWNIMKSVKVKIKDESINYLKDELEKEGFILQDNKSSIKAVYGIFLNKDNKDYYLDSITENKEMVIKELG